MSMFVFVSDMSMKFENVQTSIDFLGANALYVVVFYTVPLDIELNMLLCNIASGCP